MSLTHRVTRILVYVGTADRIAEAAATLAGFVTAAFLLAALNAGSTSLPFTLRRTRIGALAAFSAIHD